MRSHTGLLLALAAAAALLCAPPTAALTFANQTEILLRFKEQMLPRGPAWPVALATWVCPTANSSNPDGSCDPCGTESYWGNFDHVGCRGDTTEAKDVLGGNGFVTNIHITDLNIEGPVPAKELCDLKHLKEFDVDGGNLTGPIPVELSTCFPEVDEIDLSYNQLTGPVPVFLTTITKLEELKVEHNQLTGTITPEFSNMTALKWLRFGNNNMAGSLPESFSQLSGLMVQLTMDDNDFEGNLYPLAEHSLINTGTSGNPRLCGMVPTGVRFAHGFNPHNTGLGLPCPEEVAAGWADLSQSI